MIPTAKTKYPALLLIIILSFIACSKKAPVVEDMTSDTLQTPLIEADIHSSKDSSEVSVSDLRAEDITNLKLIPEGYIFFDGIRGDLNKDSIDDFITIIKGTDPQNIVENSFGEMVDRNRRGIVIALSQGNGYKKIVDNRDCFSSENEDGGVYFAPELWFEIKRNVLYIRYAHGRYGHWMYLFRYQNNAFELIGLESHSNYGPIPSSIVSINYSTGKKKTATNLNADERDDSLPEKWEEVWEDIGNDPLTKLSEIQDFDSSL